MRALGFAWALVVVLASSLTHGQDYPNRSIRVVVPFAPGGSVDVLARLLGSKLSSQLGQTVVVENRPGAGGTLAADHVAKSAPDGYTILQNTIGAAIAPAFYKSLPFDAVNDFAPVTQLVSSHLIVVASHKSDITSMKDLVAKAKTNPGKLSYGMTGVGNPLHLTMEMIKQAIGMDIVAVPFRGDAPIFTSLLGGDIEAAVVPLATAVPLIKDGRIRGLALTGAKRSEIAPEIPTVAESILPGFVSTSWHAWFMPAKTPEPIVTRIQQETAKALAFPDVQSRLTAMAFEAIGSTPAEFTAFYHAEIAKFAKVIADAKIERQ
jgi:tripartite-type tricarboxylate transporter receptor subunit TctC